MTRKGYFFVAEILAILICIALLIVFMISMNPGIKKVEVVRPGVKKTNIDRIQLGMTEQMVQEILGGPPGDHSDDQKFDIKNSRITNLRTDELKLWLADHGFAAVWFDQSGRVTYAMFSRWRSCIKQDEKEDEREYEEVEVSRFDILFNWLRRSF